MLALLTLPGLTFIAATIFTWHKTPGLFDDFTRELFIGRVISRGGLLNRDVYTIFGPFSALWNGGLMWVGGDSIATILAANLAAILAVMVIVCLLLNRLFSREAGVAGGMVFILLFAFAQYGSSESFNFAAPYSHDLTYGVLFSFLALYLLTGPPTRAAAMMSGICCGIILLTKIELIIALGMATCFQLGVNLVRRSWSPAKGAWFLAGGMIPPTVSLVLLVARGAEWKDAFASTLAAVLVFFDSAKVVADPYYQRFIGLDRPGMNFYLMLKEALKVSALIPGAALIVLIAGKIPPRWRTAGTAAFLLLLGLAFFAGPIELMGTPQGLPVLVAAMTAWSLRSKESRRKAGDGRLAFYLFSFFMLAKMILFCRLFHYGFVLALPATLAVIGFIFSDFPTLFRDRRPAIAIGAIAIAAFSWPYLELSRGWYSTKSFEIGSNGNRMIVMRPDENPWVPPTVAAIDWIERNTRPDQTVTALPTGAVFNFFTGRDSRIPFGSYTLVDTVHFEEEALLGPLQRDPPDFIVLTHNDPRRFYGLDFFGRDPRYGQLTMMWIKKHYVETARFGAEPLTDNRFGIKIMRWNGR